MRLELISFPVTQVVAGPRTAWSDGRLTVDVEALRAALRHENLESVEIHLVNPGDEVRIIHVLDVVEPRVKLGARGAFPGFTDRAHVAGEGVAHRLEGAAVIACAEVTGFQDGLSVNEATLSAVGMLDGHVATALVIPLQTHHRQRHPGEGMDRQGDGHPLRRGMGGGRRGPPPNIERRLCRRNDSWGKVRKGGRVPLRVR